MYKILFPTQMLSRFLFDIRPLLRTYRRSFSFSPSCFFSSDLRVLRPSFGPLTESNIGWVCQKSLARYIIAPEKMEKYVAQYKDEGYTVIPDFFSAEEVAELKREYVRLVDEMNPSEHRAVFMVLTIACARAARAVEECHFNEFSNTKLVSDYSAVIVEVSSLQACLGYLKDHKLTHKAVAYEASSGKCCSVLQQLNYSLEKEPGWTAFEVREESETPPTLDNVLGLCPGRALTLRKDQTISLSVYSYNYSVCVLESLRNYTNGPDCIGSITTNTPGLNYEYSVRYSSERNYDILRLVSLNQDLSFSGIGSGSGILDGPTIFLSWKTDTSVSNYGFCLTITATSKQIPAPTSTVPTTTTQTTQRTSRIPDGSEFSRGVCQWNSTYIPANGTAILSIYSELVDPCLNLASLTYGNSMNCNHVVTTDPGYTFQYYLSYNTETNLDILTLSYGGESARYSGTGVTEESIDYSSFVANWRTDGSVARNGFCLKVTSVPDIIPTNASIQGVCYEPNILVVQNYTRSVSVFSYDFQDCSDLSLLRNYAGNQFCVSRLFVANNASDYEYEITYQTQNSLDFLSIYNNIEEIRFFGNGTRKGFIEGPYLQLQWSTDSTLTGKGFCLKVRATSPDDGSGSGKIEEEIY